MREFRRVPVQLVCLALLAGWAALPLPAAARAQKPLTKVSSHLLTARALAAEGRSAAEIARAVPVLDLEGGLPRVQVRLETLTPALVEELRSRGLRGDSFHLDHALAYGTVDLADLKELASLPEVRTIQPMPRAITRVGAAANQADVTTNADDVRMDLGVDGSGARVGLISDSFRDLSAGTISGTDCDRAVTDTASQSSGDVPNGASDVIVLDDGPGGGTDEGRALAELISDIAPGANFLFHSGTNSPSDFATGIGQLVACGAELIVDDIGWTGQPFFQDGEIAAAAQAAVDGGAPYFSAAGNDATFGIDDFFLDAGAGDNACAAIKVLPDSDDLHDFGSGDTFAEIVLPDDCRLYAELQWSEPFDGALGDGAASDLDLYLLSSAADPASTAGANLLVASTTDQGCGIPVASGGDPIEMIDYTNTTGDPQSVFLAVNHCCGSESMQFRVINLSLTCDPFTLDWEDGEAGESTIFVDSQIWGHPAARDVVAVAAAFYGEIDTDGAVFPPFGGQLDVEPFSSLGGNLPFYFDEDGDPLPGFASVDFDGSPPETRFKPEITGADGTNTTFLGIDITFDSDSDPNFFGTSAAAPNALALAVLIWQLTGEFISPRALNQLIFQAIEDMELPGTDDLSGFGFADALDAASSLDGSTTPLIDDLEFDLDGGAFFSSPPTGGLQRLQAKDNLTLGDGDFTGIDGLADEIIFADGFESGDTSAWSSSTP